MKNKATSNSILPRQRGRRAPPNKPTASSKKTRHTNDNHVSPPHFELQDKTETVAQKIPQEESRKAANHRSNGRRKNPRRRLRHNLSHQAAPQPPRTRHYSSSKESKHDHKLTSPNPPNLSQIVSSPHREVGYKQEADSKIETSLPTLESDIAERLVESQQNTSESSRGSIAEIPAEESDNKKEEEVGRQQQRISSSSGRNQRSNHLPNSCKLHRHRPTQQGGGSIPKPRYKSTKTSARGGYEHQNFRHHRKNTYTQGVSLCRPLRPHRRTSNTEGNSQHRAPSSSGRSSRHPRTRSGEGSCLHRRTKSCGRSSLHRQTSSGGGSGLHRRTSSGGGSSLHRTCGLHQKEKESGRGTGRQQGANWTRGVCKDKRRATTNIHTNREEAVVEINQRENQPNDSRRKEVTSEAPWRVQTNGPQRLKERQGSEILQTGSQCQFLQNMYCTSHAIVQHKVDRCMDTNINESLGTPADSHKLQQHCMCVLEFRTHTKCCILGRTHDSKPQKPIAKKILCIARIKNDSKNNNHLKHPVDVIIFTSRRMNLLRTHIDSHACQEFLKQVVNTFEHLTDPIFYTSGVNLMRKLVVNHTYEELLKHVINTLEQSEVIILLTHGKNNLIKTHINRHACQEFLKYRVNTFEYSEYVIFLTHSRMMLASTHIDSLEYSVSIKHVACIYCKYHNSKLYEKNFFPTTHI